MNGDCQFTIHSLNNVLIHSSCCSPSASVESLTIGATLQLALDGREVRIFSIIALFCRLKHRILLRPELPISNLLNDGTGLASVFLIREYVRMQLANVCTFSFFLHFLSAVLGVQPDGTLDYSLLDFDCYFYCCCHMDHNVSGNWQGPATVPFPSRHTLGAFAPMI